MKTLILLVLSVLLVLSLIGCASVGRPLDPFLLTKIKIGESTRADVEALLGPPTSIGFRDDGQGPRTVLTYLYSYSEVKGETFIPYVGMFAGGINIRSQCAIISIGPDGKVSGVTYTAGRPDVSSGLLATPPPPK